MIVDNLVTLRNAKGSVKEGQILRRPFSLPFYKSMHRSNVYYIFIPSITCIVGRTIYADINHLIHQWSRQFRFKAIKTYYRILLRVKERDGNKKLLYVGDRENFFIMIELYGSDHSIMNVS